jgi:hypothetical protein
VTDALVRRKDDTITSPTRPTSGYYRVVTGDDFEIGELVYLVGLKDGKCDVVCGDHHYTIDPAKFRANCTPAPDGMRERQEQMARLMTEISDIEDDYRKLTEQTANFNPHVNTLGQLTDNPAPEGNALVSMPEIKRSVAGMKNSLLKFNKSLKAKTAHFQALAQEQANIMAARANELARRVEQAEEVVWTINLYLGQNEEILRLTKGVPASADLPITIRQLVLFMDEECAVASDTGGIDARSIDQFDKWLTDDPAHLQQVLPEQKGIIALKPRRYHRDYGDPWLNKTLAEANKATYFLMRNGGNLYRIWTDYNVGHTLVPVADEFLNILHEDEWGTHTKKPLKPGSDAYMKRMKQVSAKQRHYLRVCLIIQGLIDRTAIFKPLPAEHVNICDQADFDRYIRIIHDAENTLGDGRPDFGTWLADLNSQLSKGERIIGIFKNWEYGLGREREGRIWPNGANLPDDLTLHTLEERVADSDKPAFHIYYKRGEIWRRGDYYKRGGYGETKIRARCLVYSADDFILAFDRADPVDMQRYLESRQDRHSYTHMFPLLKRAIKIKAEEAAIEEPFAKLLVGQIMARHHADVDIAQELVPELIRWWKFKNQTHRALTSDDKLAIKMIVDEYAIRRRRDVERTAITLDGFDDYAVKFIRAALGQSTLLVAHKRGNEYVALVAAGTGNIWVHEVLYKSNRSSNNLGDKLREVERKEWVTTDKRHERWQVLYSSGRWAQWVIGADRRLHLMDHEVDEVLQRGLGLISGDIRFSPPLKWFSGRRKADDDETVCWPLGACLDSEGRIHIYYCDCPANIPKHLALHDHASEPSIAHNRVDWQRKGANLVVYLVDHHHVTYRDKPPWQPGYDGPLSCARGTSATARMLQEWPENTTKLKAEFELYGDYSKKRRNLERIQREVIQSINQQLSKLLEDNAYKDYLAEHGDPELWEDQKKNYKTTCCCTQPVLHLITFMLNNAGGHPLEKINGRTIAELRAEALSLGWLRRSDDTYSDGDDEPIDELIDEPELSVLIEIEEDDDD